MKLGFKVKPSRLLNMTTVGGHSSAYPMQGEQVGMGARRKITHQHPASRGEHHNRVPVNIVDMSNTIGLPHNAYKKRDRRHVYHDILPLKIGQHGNKTMCEQSDGKIDITLPTTSASQKPAIPPKPKYILRDKRLRHVYQTIDLPASISKDGAPVLPPPLPHKPPYLQKLDDFESSPPPLPPRVVNVDAIRQRQKLDHEYFENLRKSVDGDLLDLAEEGDLPVSVRHDAQLPTSRTRQDYGTHSPPLPISVTTFVDGDQSLQPGTRRHSLPLYESISDTENIIGTSNLSNSPPPALPVRSDSQDFESEDDTVDLLPLLHKLPKKSQSEVNLSQNLILLKKCGWYWGNMTWQEAEKLLSSREGEGVFLMRDSQNPLHLLTLTVRSTTNTVHHVRVEYSEGKFQLYEPGRTVSRSTAQCVRHSNIEQFINLAIKHSKSGSFLYFLKPKNMGELPVQIRFMSPISRFSKVKSLQYLSRMAIRNCIVAELMPSLSLPPKIRQYLMSGPYYDPNEDI